MRGQLLAVVAAAFGLRLVRAALRWDEITLAYAAYLQPWQDHLRAGDLGGMLSTFVGLHPPLYPALFSAVDLAWGAPAGWLLMSVAASTLAVWVVGRAAGLAAAATLAVDPLQLAYCAEVNNYPLLVLIIALCLAAERRASDGRGWGPLALAGVAGGWTHLLGGLAGGLFALKLARRDLRAGLAVLGVMAAGTAPVVARGLALAGGEGTYGQGGLDPAALAGGLHEKLGLWGLVWGLALVGGVRRPGLLAVAFALAAAILGMMGLGVAASHQQPYWLALGPLVAALVGAWRPLGLVAVGLGLWGFGPELDRLEALQRDLGRPRAIDAAIAAIPPGGALWLLAPALMPDDDKRDTSDVLWRLEPFRPAPPWRGDGAPAFEFTDYRFGQPRWLAGRVVHTSTDLSTDAFDAALGWHLAAGRPVGVVLYDHGPAFDYPGKVRRALDPYDHRCVEVGADVGLGVDLLCVVEGLR
ncbi:MAG: hypothetical protein H6739_23875 [Alphaproteobacteria bacterium]|nr:hypothetical protein [Alphaproteobacteria bacterium]